MSLRESDLVDARCRAGHVVRWGAAPLRVKKGEVPNLCGRPIRCGVCDQPLGFQK